MLVLLCKNTNDKYILPGRLITHTDELVSRLQDELHRPPMFHTPQWPCLLLCPVSFARVAIFQSANVEKEWQQLGKSNRSSSHTHN